MDASVNVIILAPPQPLITGSRSDRNANMIVILLDYNNTEILLVGDPEEEIEQWQELRELQQRERRGQEQAGDKAERGQEGCVRAGA